MACTKKGTVTWKSEITKHTDLVSFVYSTDRKSMDVDLTNMREIQEDISIIQHSSFLKFKNMLRTIYDNRDIVLIIDECHHLRNPESEAGKIIRYMIRHSEYTWAMTATPMLNKIQDLYRVFDMILPGYLAKDEWDFLQKYTIQQQRKSYIPVKPGSNYRGSTKKIRGRLCRVIKFWDIVGHKNIPELVRLISPHFLKRARDLNLKFHYHKCPRTEEEEELYFKAAQGILSEEREQHSARLHDLQRVVNGTIDENFQLMDSRELSTKEELYVKVLNEIFDRGEAAISFTSYRDTIERKKRLLDLNAGDVLSNIGSVYEITGDTTNEECAAIVSQFSVCDVIVMTHAGGESLNLQASNNVIFFDIPFSLARSRIFC